jgi:hypothetical protein
MASFFDDLELGGAGVIDLLSETASRATGGFLPQTYLAAEVWAEQEGQAQGLTTQQQAQLQTVAKKATQQGVLNVAAAKTAEQVKEKVDTGLGEALYIAKWGAGVASAALVLFLGVKAYQELKPREG